MANLSDPNVALQILTHRASGWRVPAEQISGVQVGYVLDNNLTNPDVNPVGMCSVVVPNFSPSTRLGPIPYPGSLVPPGGGLPGPTVTGGTQCIVSFIPPSANSQSAIAGQIVAFVGWPPANGASNPSASESTQGQWFFNTTTNTPWFFNGSIWINAATAFAGPTGPTGPTGMTGPTGHTGP